MLDLENEDEFEAKTEAAEAEVQDLHRKLMRFGVTRDQLDEAVEDLGHDDIYGELRILRRAWESAQRISLDKQQTGKPRQNASTAPTEAPTSHTDPCAGSGNMPISDAERRARC